MTITYIPTLKEQAGLDAVTAAYNAASGAALTSDEYAAQRLSDMLTGWANDFQCGAIPVGEFIRRFTGTEVDCLKALAATDLVVAGFMNALDTAPAGKVWLLSDTVAQVKAYLTSIAASWTTDVARIAVIFAVS